MGVRLRVGTVENWLRIRVEEDRIHRGVRARVLARQLYASRNTRKGKLPSPRPRPRDRPSPGLG